MVTDKYRIIEVVKEPEKEPRLYDWNMTDHIGTYSWLLVYDKDHANGEPAAFLGTRYITSDISSIRIIHAAQSVTISHTSSVFFFDLDSEEDLNHMQKGFMFSLDGWLIPREHLSAFIDAFMENKIDRDIWQPFYKSIGFFDDFEGTGDMMVKVADL